MQTFFDNCCKSIPEGIGDWVSYGFTLMSKHVLLKIRYPRRNQKMRVPMIFPYKIGLNLILSAATVALGATTLSNVAQAANLSMPQTVAQTASPSGPSDKPKIVLTEKQRAQIESIRKNENSQIIAVLTPEQKTLIQQAAQSNKASGSVEADLKLTEEQKAKIVSIQKESRKQIESVLTPEQLQILQKQPTQ